MSSRQEEKAAARAAREAAEAEAAARTRRKRRLGLLGGAVLAAAAIVAAAVALSTGGGGNGTPAPTGPPAGAGQVASLLGGIPQHGTTLGDPSAPVTLVEFGDLKCPVCKAWDEAVLPTIVTRYVRAGKVKLVYHPQAFVGEQLNPGDSRAAAKFALATAEQDRFWSFTTLFYRNQQDENTRYVTDAFLRRIARAVPGLDVSQAFQARDSAAVARKLQQSQALFAAHGLTSTPSFLLGGPGRRLTLLPYQSVTDVGTFTQPIDALLEG